MRNTADVTDGKPIAVLSQSMSGVSDIAMQEVTEVNELGYLITIPPTVWLGKLGARRGEAPLTWELFRSI
jgi:hypothetical protein